MYAGDRLESFALSLFHAAHRDLSEDGRTDLLQVLAVFDETHSDTSLGRGGLAGQAITVCLTVVVANGSRAAVYRAGRLDYIFRVDQKIRDYIAHQHMPTRRDAKKSGLGILSVAA